MNTRLLHVVMDDSAVVVCFSSSKLACLLVSLVLVLHFQHTRRTPLLSGTRVSSKKEGVTQTRDFRAPRETGRHLLKSELTRHAISIMLYLFFAAPSVPSLLDSLILTFLVFPFLRANQSRRDTS